jgi:2-oxoglutarate ferredoxin oxidoreductase subunit alpha
MSSVFTVKIVGPAGAGIKSGGLLLSRILLSHGQHLIDYSEYPSLVRGGHNTYQVSFSHQPVSSIHYQLSLLISLEPNHWQLHKTELTKKSLVFGPDAPLVLPLSDLVKPIGGHIYANTVALGVIAYCFGFDPSICHSEIINTFSLDSPNLTAFDAGFQYAQNNFIQYQDIFKIHSNAPVKRALIVDGSEAFGHGFLVGGGNFYAAYPMTPSTGLLHFLAQKQLTHPITVLHPEDEISSASLAVGAAFAGARAAVGTSGGGFALMNETVSFCGVANLGVVFYLASRPGPATGLPTWTAQGDLLHAVFSGHGEFNKIVLTPGTHAESYQAAIEALNLAARFDVPVIVLTDKLLAESSASFTPPTYIPKVVSSPRHLPGSDDSFYMANSYEHDQNGFSIEDASLVKKVVTARLSLSKKIVKYLPKPVFYGSDQAKTLILTWGSTKMAVLEALNMLDNPSKIGLLHFPSLWPINPNWALMFKPFKNILVIENNATSQLSTLLASAFPFKPTSTLLNCDGRPIYPEQIVKYLKPYVS